MEDQQKTRTVYRHIKTAIHINIALMLLIAPLLLTQLLWVIAIVEVLLFTTLIRTIVIDFTEYMVLEDHCVNVHTGLFFQRNNRVPYTKMNSIDITNFFWFHNLEIDAGNDISEIKFSWIQDAHMLKEALDQKLMINNYYQNSQHPQNPQSSQQQEAQNHMSRNIQELNQLAYLQSKGVITPQEFEMQKYKILNN